MEAELGPWDKAGVCLAPGWTSVGQWDLKGHVIAELKPRLRVDPGGAPGLTYVVTQLREVDGRLGPQPQAPSQGQGADQGAVSGQARQAKRSVQQAVDVPPGLLRRAEPVLSGCPAGSSSSFPLHTVMFLPQVLTPRA